MSYRDGLLVSPLRSLSLRVETLLDQTTTCVGEAWSRGNDNKIMALRSEG